MSLSHVAELVGAKENRLLVTVGRENLVDTVIQGFVLGFSEQLILLQGVRDFRLEGHYVLKRKDVTMLKTTPSDYCHHAIMEADGSVDLVDFDPWMPLGNWRDYLCSLDKKVLVILEGEKDGEEIYFIGRLDEVREDSVKGTYFSETGSWEDAPWGVGMEYLHSVQTGTSYLQGFARFFDRENSWGFDEAEEGSAV